MRNMRRSALALGVLVALLQTNSLADVCPPVGIKSTVSFWYIDYEYICQYEGSMEAAAAYSGLYGPMWSTSDHESQSTVTNPPGITIQDLIGGVNNKGAVHVSTHGSMVNNGMSAEIYPTENSRDVAYTAYINNNTYTADQIDKSFLPTDKYSIRLTNAGIHDKLSPGSNVFVQLDVSNGYATSSYWQHMATFAGYDGSPTYPAACASYEALFDVMKCNHWTDWQADNDVNGAMNQSPNNPFDNLDNPSTGLKVTGDRSWRFNCGVTCDYIAATFVRTGAFSNKAWAAVDQYGSKTFELLGFASWGDIPKDGVLLETISANSGNGRRVYIFDGIAVGSYAAFAIREIDDYGHETWSMPFVSTGQPADWNDLVGFNNEQWSFSPPALVHAGAPLTEVTASKANQRDRAATVAEPAQVAVYGSESTLVLAEYLALLSRGWTVRGFVGDGSTSQARAAIQMVIDDNIAYNAWCAQQPSCTPYTIEPTLGLVGDPKAGTIQLGVFDDPDGLHCQYYSSCMDFGSSGNLASSPIEDIPVYLLPATAVSDITNLSSSAVRYESGTNLSGRATLLVGDRFLGQKYTRASESLTPVRELLMHEGFAKRELAASSYCDSCLAAKEGALVDAVNAGTSLIVGFGHPTSMSYWPGGFLSRWGFDWSQEFTKPQTAVAILPNCYTGAEQHSDPHDPCTPDCGSQVRKGLFATTSGTTLGFVTGHMNGGFGGQHELWLEVLMGAYDDAAVGTPWSTIVLEAKRRVEAQYPFLIDYVRSVASLGTMLRKVQPGVTAVQELPPMALGLWVEGGVVQRVSFALPEERNVRLMVYDVRGREIANLYSGKASAGVHRLTWNGRNGDGERVGAGVYFARLTTDRGEGRNTKVVVAH